MIMKHSNRLKRKIALLSALLALIGIFSIQMATSQTSGAVVSVVPEVDTGRVGETFTVNITLSNVPNLYGVDVTLDWNASILQFISATSLLGVESHPGGVLHDAVSIAANGLSEEVEGEYNLVATSVNPAASFNGSGTIATITFNVTKVGHSDLTLQSELADHPLPDEVSNLIDHIDASGSFDSVIPEFPSAFAVATLLVVVTVGLLFSKKLHKKNPAQ